jgi:hypothetical protein
MRFLERSLRAGACVGALLVAASAWGAAVSGPRFDALPRMCAKGPLKGVACTEKADCQNNPCVIAFERHSAFTATLTLVVDDDVSQFDGSEDVPNVVAVTALLEVRAHGRDIHAQIFQNLAGADFAALVQSLQQGPEVASNVGLGRRLDENQLNTEAADEAELIDAFLFQEGDSGFVEALRAQFGSAGTPVIVAVSRVQHFDHQADERASVVRVRVKGKFLLP